MARNLNRGVDIFDKWSHLKKASIQQDQFQCKLKIKVLTMVKKIAINFCLLLSLGCGQAMADTTAEVATKLPLKSVLIEIPTTTMSFLKTSFSQPAVPVWIGIIGSSAVLYHYDEDLYRGAQQTGRRWGLSNSDKTKTVFKLGQYDILRLPSDGASALYFLGDGWLDVAVAGSFFAVGSIGDHVRPYNTSLQLAHGLIVSAMFEQFLKHATGRESPSDQSEPRGKWRPFPSLKAYGANTAKYDAMPSGHMMTATLMFTIIRYNYQEYDYFLLPLEVTWLGTLGFAMLNNGVHWASDYPLGIGLGYVIGRSAVRMGQASNKQVKVASRWSYFPYFTSDGVTTLNAMLVY